MGLLKKNTVHISVVPLSFSVGIVISGILSVLFNWTIVFNLVSFVGLLIFASLVISGQLRIILALVAGCLLGLYHSGLSISNQKIATTYIGREVNIVATVQDWPEVKNNQTRLHLGNPLINYSTRALNCHLFATM